MTKEWVDPTNLLSGLIGLGSKQPLRGSLAFCHFINISSKRFFKYQPNKNVSSKSRCHSHDNKNDNPC